MLRYCQFSISIHTVPCYHSVNQKYPSGRTPQSMIYYKESITQFTQINEPTSTKTSHNRWKLEISNNDILWVPPYPRVFVNVVGTRHQILLWNQWSHLFQNFYLTACDFVKHQLSILLKAETPFQCSVWWFLRCHLHPHSTNAFAYPYFICIYYSYLFKM